LQLLRCCCRAHNTRSQGFFGCRHFSETNRLLQEGGHVPIDWQIDSL
jgi:uracil-DNA glycosylase